MGNALLLNLNPCALVWAEIESSANKIAMRMFLIAELYISVINYLESDMALIEKSQQK